MEVLGRQIEEMGVLDSPARCITPAVSDLAHMSLLFLKVSWHDIELTKVGAIGKLRKNDFFGLKL